MLTPSAPPPPEISIGMPVYNGEETLANAISSILEQTYFNFELIISNNASTDSTAKICEYFSSIDSRIRYSERAKNISVSENFKHVLERATASYFMWAASDDLWQPNWIEELLPISQKFFCLANGNCVEINFDGSVSTHIASGYQFSFTGNPEQNRKQFFLTPSFLGTGNAIYGIAPTQIFSEMSSKLNGPRGDVTFLYSLLSKYQIRLNQNTTRYVRLKPNFLSDTERTNTTKQLTLRYHFTYLPNMLRTVLKSIYFCDYWRQSSNSERVMLIFRSPLAIIRAVVVILQSKIGA